MAQYVALLRGINVGGNNKVEMKQLNKTFESLGFTNVMTYINTGNIIFSSPNRPDTEMIERAILKDFGILVPVLIRSAENIINVCNSLPKHWENNTEQKTDILFLWDEHDPAKTLDLIVQNSEVDELNYFEGAIIWHIDRSVYNKSGMHKFVSTKLYKSMTARNINTIRKLSKLL